MESKYCDWTVIGKPYIRPVGNLGKSEPYVMCRCKCGRERSVSVYKLKAGRTSSCGHGSSIDLIDVGREYGHWTVLDVLRSSGKYRMCLARCKCGTVKEVNAAHILLGNTTQCRSCADRRNSVQKQEICKRQSKRNSKNITKGSEKKLGSVKMGKTSKGGL